MMQDEAMFVRKRIFEEVELKEPIRWTEADKECFR
jgi:tRNA(Met) C34 N-acetyltransferase TmcA